MIPDQNCTNPSLQLLDQIIKAWSQDKPLPEEAIIAEWALPGEGRLRKYFAGRRLSQINLSDRHVHTGMPFYESFTDEAKVYYAGVYLKHLLNIYSSSPPCEGDLPSDHFLHYITGTGRSLPTNRDQSLAITQVLHLVADRMDKTYVSEEQIEKLLEAIQYWDARAQPIAE